MISSAVLQWSFHSSSTAEVDSDTLVVNHHVIASVVAIAGGRLALTVQYFAAHVLNVRNTLESLQVVTAVMTGKEKMDVILFHIVLYPLCSVHDSRKVGENQ